MDTSDYWIIDGHIDTIPAMVYQKRVFSEPTELGQCNYVKMREGNMAAALFAVYPADSPESIAKGVEEWKHVVGDPTNNIMQIKSVDDFDHARSQEKIGAVLHFEGAGGIDAGLENLRKFYSLGLRTIGLTHVDTNKFATGAVFQGEQLTTGLTEMGKVLVAEAQNLGITVDVSHLNDPSFWDVIANAEKPIIASHSNSRSICNHVRNLSDEMILAIRDLKGTIGLNFGVHFTDPERNPDNLDLPFGIYKDHIDHIVEIGGIDIMAMGSDFDGTRIPRCFTDARDMPRFFTFLADNGYSKQDLLKISHGNLRRVFRATWK